MTRPVPLPASTIVRGGACLLGLMWFLAVDTSPGAEPPTLREEVKVRVRTARLRILPVRTAAPGACLNVGPEDLEITLRGEPVRDPSTIQLDRERLPTLHALVLDTSDSMAGNLGEMRRAATGYVEKLDPSRDRALIMTFDDDVVLAQGATADHSSLLRGIDAVRIGFSTAMLDALYDTIRELDAHRERPVIVLLTDGFDTTSLHERDDVLKLVDRRPDLTIFTIGLALPPLPTIGPSGLLSSRSFLARLAARANGEFFETPTPSQLDGVYRRIREMLESEATLNVLDPDSESESGELRVASRDPSCRVKVLRGTEGSPTRASDYALYGPPPTLPYTLSLAPDPRVKTFLRTSQRTIDPVCRKETVGAGRDDEESPESLWRLNVEPGRLYGCHLDVTMERGLLFDPYAEQRVEPNAWLGLRTRPLDIAVPSPPELPRAPEELLDRLARLVGAAEGTTIETDPRKRPAEQHARPYYDLPELCSGRAFFDLRPRLAHALFLIPEYHDWALASLRKEADQEFQAWRESLLKLSSSRPADGVFAAARESREGARILARASTPSERDLERHLGAWLGDIPAHSLFARWEAIWIDRLLGPVGTPVALSTFPDDWSALRRIFFVPSYARTLTLLAPVYDLASNRIGFYRVVLPRAGWLLPRVQGPTRDEDRSDIPLDLVPEQPLGYLAMRRFIVEYPVLASSLVERSLHPTAVTYELLGKPRTWDPKRAFRRTRVSIAFTQRGASADAAPRLDVSVELESPREELSQEPRITALAVEAHGDPRLDEIARAIVDTAVSEVGNEDRR